MHLEPAPWCMRCRYRAQSAIVHQAEGGDHLDCVGKEQTRKRLAKIFSPGQCTALSFNHNGYGDIFSASLGFRGGVIVNFVHPPFFLILFGFTICPSSPPQRSPTPNLTNNRRGRLCGKAVLALMMRVCSAASEAFKTPSLSAHCLKKKSLLLNRHREEP